MSKKKTKKLELSVAERCVEHLLGTLTTSWRELRLESFQQQLIKGSVQFWDVWTKVRRDGKLTGTNSFVPLYAQLLAELYPELKVTRKKSKHAKEFANLIAQVPRSTLVA